MIDNFYLSRQPDRETDTVAVGVKGPGNRGRGISFLCPGAGVLWLPAAAGADGAVRFSQHPHGGRQYPGLPAQRGLFFTLAPAVLCMEGDAIK